MPPEEEQALNKDQDTPEPDQDDGTGPDPSQAQGEPLDPNIYDDGGVPWKNRAMEANRKLQEAEERQRYIEQQRYQPPPQPQQPQQQSDPYEELISLAQTDPKRFVQNLEGNILKKVREETFKQQKERSVQSALGKYPDLRNPQSDFYRAVDREMWELKRMGFNPDTSPNAVEMIADRVAKLNSGNGQTHPQRPAQQPNRLPTLGQTPSKPAAPKATIPELKDTFAKGLDAVGDEFSSDELKQVRERLRNRDAAGEFDVM